MMIVIYNWLLICYNYNSRIRWVKHMRILDVDEISVEKEKIKKEKVTTHIWKFLPAIP